MWFSICSIATNKFYSNEAAGCYLLLFPPHLELWRPVLEWGSEAAPNGAATSRHGGVNGGLECFTRQHNAKAAACLFGGTTVAATPPSILGNGKLSEGHVMRKANDVANFPLDGPG